MISSDSFAPYPKRIGSQVGNGQVLAGGPVAGVLAGSPPPGSSPPNNPSIPITVTDTLVNYTPNPSTSPPQIVAPPVGAIDALKYIQVVNTGPGFVLVIQGSFLGITPPFSACRYTLSGAPGSGVSLTGWDGAYPAAVGKNAAVFILWAANPFSNDISWEGPSSSGGGGFVGVPFEEDRSTSAFVSYTGFTTETFGVQDIWALTMNTFSNVGGSVTPGKVGTISVLLALTVSISVSSPTTLPIDFYVLDSMLGPDVFVATLPVGATSGAILIPFNANYLQYSGVGLMNSPPSAWSVNIYAVQPTGGSTLSSTVSITGATMTLFQTQLQS